MPNAKPTLKSTLKALLYLAPLLIVTAVFTLWPLCHAFLMSWYVKYNYYTDQVQSRGGANFAYLWHDPDFHVAVRNTVVFVLGVVPLTVLLALGIALLLTRIPRLAGLFRTVYFLPFVTSTVAISLVWRWLFHRDVGPLNGLLRWCGLTPIDWLNDPHAALAALIIVCVWQGLGFNIILFLAGLAHINPHYAQAAALDGANAWQRFTTITWPLLTPITLLVTINAIINSFKVFDQIYALFGGTAGPANAALTLLYYVYQKFYVENNYPVAAAGGVVLFGLIALVTLLAAGAFRHYYHRLGGDQ